MPAIEEFEFIRARVAELAADKAPKPHKWQGTGYDHCSHCTIEDPTTYCPHGCAAVAIERGLVLPE